MARGYTPTIFGQGGISKLPERIHEAFLETQAFRKLNKVLRSSHTTKLVPIFINVGDRKLGYIEKSFGKYGIWKEV